MLTLIKKVSGILANGTFLSGHPDIVALDLERDYADIDRLFVEEEWPFLRTDLEVSHQQPLATAFVARQKGQFAGFFAAHTFGPIGYLDMMIVAPPFRTKGVARPLYFKTVNALRRKGITSFVVHTTNDSARLIRLLGFKAGQTFTLLRREPVRSDVTGPARDVASLGPRDETDLIHLDETIFGIKRDTWVRSLLAQPTTQFFGLRRDGALAASVCLRPRRHNALCLDGANALRLDDLARLVTCVTRRFSLRRLDCFVRTESNLEALLLGEGFSVPTFFQSIGPLVEWRKGWSGDIGRSPRVHCLSWF